MYNPDFVCWGYCRRTGDRSDLTRHFALAVDSFERIVRRERKVWDFNKGRDLDLVGFVSAWQSQRRAHNEERKAGSSWAPLPPSLQMLFWNRNTESQCSNIVSAWKDEAQIQTQGWRWNAFWMLLSMHTHPSLCLRFNDGVDIDRSPCLICF